MIISRYIQIRTIVNNIYLHNNIIYFPVKIKKIIYSFKDIKIIKYSSLIKKYAISLKEIKDELCSDDGCTAYDPNSSRYIIYYNDIEMNKTRIKWTLAHELGHILLKHHFNSDGTINKFLSEDEYIYKEYEANLFASWILAHPVILSNLDIINPSDLVTFCGISYSAANIRYLRFSQHERGKMLIQSDNDILNNFNAYLEDKHEDYLIQQRFVNSFKFAY